MVDTGYPAPAPDALKRCPACRLPITAATLGNAVAASSDDHHHHVVVASSDDHHHHVVVASSDDHHHHVVVASSDDHHHHVVVAICRRCASSASRIPAHAYRKLLNRAADRALADHDRYLCTHVADAGAARLAVGLLGHPAHVLEALDALGWG